jgi:ATP-dependent Clp protease ATP-binding subunit ClpB
LRRRPYAEILFDGVEKAYPDVFSVMLQILNDGRVTDGQGRTVDFTDTVLILTSHIGSASILDLAGDPARHAEMGKRVNEALRPTSARRFSTAWMSRSSSTASRPRSRAKSWSCR